MMFHERQLFDGDNVPVWICTNASCGYRTFVRGAGAGPITGATPPDKAGPTLVHTTTSPNARARRTSMKSRARVGRGRRLVEQSTELFPPFSLNEAWIETDANGIVIGASPAGAQLTGYSTRSVQGRALPILFVKDRPGPAQLRYVTLGHSVERDSWIRPRERRAIHVRYRIDLAQSTPPNIVLRWTFERIG